MMQDKTPIYMMVIVGMVALVGLVVIITAPGATTDVGITGNVVSDNTYYDTASSGAFGKIFFTVFLLGIAGYMYFKLE
jgi:hypothetical protein